MNRTVRVHGTYLSLRAVARLSGVAPHKVRRYESEGLILANRVIPGERGERLYETSVVHLVRRIRSYETIGVNYAGIEVILRLLEQRGPKARR